VDDDSRRLVGHFDHLAFIAGLLSFLSPCVLPLVPIYLGYLGGTALGNLERQPAEDWTVEKIS
jgi:cytochrome c biogenesis protein CcdA